jgi:hypothetical protein
MKFGLSEESGLQVGVIKTLITIQLFTLSCYIRKEIYFSQGCDSEKVMIYYLAKKTDENINESCTLYLSTVFDI